MTDWKDAAQTKPPIGAVVLIWDQYARLGKWSGYSWLFDNIETTRDPEWWSAFDEPELSS